MPLPTVNHGGILDGTITNADIGNNQIQGGKLATDIDLPNGATATTQSSGNNTTRVATTAFVTTAVNAIDQDAIVTPQAAQNNRTFSTGNNHLMAGPVTIAAGQTFTLTNTARLIIA